MPEIRCNGCGFAADPSGDDFHGWRLLSWTHERAVHAWWLCNICRHKLDQVMERHLLGAVNV